LTNGGRDFMHDLLAKANNKSNESGDELNVTVEKEGKRRKAVRRWN
jgi:hypothetical protein